MLCTIQNQLHNLKIAKKTLEGVLRLSLLEVTLLHGYFLHFSNCANCTKLHKASRLISFLAKKREINHVL